MSIFKSSKLMAAAGLIFMAGTVFAQNGTTEEPWNIGAPDNPGGAGAVTASMRQHALSAGGGHRTLLTITGTGQMRNFTTTSAAPWVPYDLSDAVIEEGVTNIGNQAFYGLKTLSTVEMPNSVTSIGTQAFGGTALKSVTFGTDLTFIDRSAFQHCDNIESMTFLGATPPSTPGTGKDPIITGISSAATIKLYVPPSAVEAYRSHDIWGKFHSVSPLQPGSNDNEWPCGTSVTCALEGGIVVVRGTGAMYDYIYLEVLFLAKGAAQTQPAPGDTLHVPDWWLNHRTTVTAVVVEDGVTSVGNNAFRDLPNLTTITLGKDVATIGAGSFGYSTAITTVTSLNPFPPDIVSAADCPPTGCSVLSFESVNLSAVTLIIPEGSVSAYSTDVGFIGFGSKQTTNINPRSLTRANSAAPTVSVRGKMLSVSSSNNSALSIRMIDMRGKTVARFNAGALRATPLHQQSFSLTKIPAGRYFVDVKGAGVRQTVPVVIK